MPTESWLKTSWDLALSQQPTILCHGISQPSHHSHREMLWKVRTDRRFTLSTTHLLKAMMVAVRYSTTAFTSMMVLMVTLLMSSNKSQNCLLGTLMVS